MPEHIAALGALALLVAAAGCATPDPGPTRVVRMGGQDNAAYAGHPPAGAVWRLHEDELRALGPIVPAPDPPPAPPPREREPEVIVVPSVGYFDSHPGFGFSIGIGSGWGRPYYWPGYGWYSYPRHRHYRRRH